MIANTNAVVYPDFHGNIKIRPYVKEFVDCFSSLHIDIFSTCEKKIFWKNQLGFNCIQPKVKPTFISGYHFNYQEELVYVNITMTIGPHAITELEELLEDLKLWYPEYNPSRFREVIYINDDIPGVHNVHRNTSQFAFSIVFSIPVDAIEQNGGTVYISHIGLLIGFEENAKKAQHPLSARYFRDLLTEDLASTWEGYSQLRILVVDNTGHDHIYWYNTGFVINERYCTFPVKMIRNPQLKSGFYVTVMDAKCEYHTLHYELEAGEKTLGVYRSRKQAEDFGSPKDRHGRELLEREYNNNILKLEIAERKTELERMALGMKEKEMEVHKLKLQLEETEANHARERFEIEQAYKEKEDALRLEEARLRQEELNTKERVLRKKATGDILKSVVEIVKGILAAVPVVLGLYKFIMFVFKPKST